MQTSQTTHQIETSNQLRPAVPMLSSAQSQLVYFITILGAVHILRHHICEGKAWTRVLELWFVSRFGGYSEERELSSDSDIWFVSRFGGY